MPIHFVLRIEKFDQVGQIIRCSVACCSLCLHKRYLISLFRYLIYVVSVSAPLIQNSATLNEPYSRDEEPHDYLPRQCLLYKFCVHIQFSQRSNFRVLVLLLLTAVVRMFFLWMIELMFITSYSVYSKSVAIVGMSVLEFLPNMS